MPIFNLASRLKWKWNISKMLEFWNKEIDLQKVLFFHDSVFMWKLTFVLDSTMTGVFLLSSDAACTHTHHICSPQMILREKQTNKNYFNMSTQLKKNVVIIYLWTTLSSVLANYIINFNIIIKNVVSILSISLCFKWEWN